MCVCARASQCVRDPFLCVCVCVCEFDRRALGWGGGGGTDLLVHSARAVVPRELLYRKHGSIYVCAVVRNKPSRKAVAENLGISRREKYILLPWCYFGTRLSCVMADGSELA